VISFATALAIAPPPAQLFWNVERLIAVAALISRFVLEKDPNALFGRDRSIKDFALTEGFWFAVGVPLRYWQQDVDNV
jgi:hypothetical protein